MIDHAAEDTEGAVDASRFPQALAFGVATGALAGCMGAGAQIPSASTPITQAEARQGAEYHPQLLAELQEALLADALDGQRGLVGQGAGERVDGHSGWADNPPGRGRHEILGPPLEIPLEVEGWLDPRFPRAGKKSAGWPAESDF